MVNVDLWLRCLKPSMTLDIALNGMMMDRQRRYLVIETVSQDC